MIDLLHGRAARRLAQHSLATFGANAVMIVAAPFFRLHAGHQEIGERVHFAFGGRHFAAILTAVQRVSGARGHLTGWAGIDGLIDGLVGGGVLGAGPVDAVVVGIHLPLVVTHHVAAHLEVVVERWLGSRCGVSRNRLTLFNTFQTLENIFGPQY